MYLNQRVGKATIFNSILELSTYLMWYVAQRASYFSAIYPAYMVCSAFIQEGANQVQAKSLTGLLLNEMACLIIGICKS